MSNDMDSHYQAERAKLLAEPCRCVPCGACAGNGSICVEMGTGKYIGAHPYDDLFDLAPCDQCDGGVVEVCARCETINELDLAYGYSSEDY